jgi:hypothetical protein
MMMIAKDKIVSRHKYYSPSRGKRKIYFPNSESMPTFWKFALKRLGYLQVN